MRFLWVVVMTAVTAIEVTFADESSTADALATEHVRAAIADLDNPDFKRRENAANQLLMQGRSAIPSLTEAAEIGSAEVSVRAFDVLQRLHRDDDEQTSEAVEIAFGMLKRSEHLAVAERTERALRNSSEFRRDRGIALFERLGGIVQYLDRASDRNFEPRPAGTPRIQYVMIGRDWVGGEEGLRYLGRIEDIRLSGAALYIIRGIVISDAKLLDLQAELPFLQIQRRRRRLSQEASGFLTRTKVVPSDRQRRPETRPRSSEVVATRSTQSSCSRECWVCVRGS